MAAQGAAARPARRGGRTSNAAKKKYNDRVYSKYSFLVPKGGGLDQYLHEVRGRGESMGDAIRHALVEHIAARKGVGGQSARPQEAQGPQEA